MVKSKIKIYEDIKNRFEVKTGETTGSVLDMFSMSVAQTDEEIYQEIEKNKTPHVWTYLSGGTLDATGLWVNCPRDVGENDSSYRYRLMQWMLKNEACNNTAIKVALLNPVYASNIEFVSLTNGCGTGTCYVLPRRYTEENIKASLEEARTRISKIASPTIYVDYIIPEIKSISFEIYLKTSNGDETIIKEQLTSKIKEYVNTVPPKEYLEIGRINKIGTNLSQVDYFNVLSLIVNGEQLNKIKILQEIETKFIFDNIIWIGDKNDA